MHAESPCMSFFVNNYQKKRRFLLEKGTYIKTFPEKQKGS